MASSSRRVEFSDTVDIEEFETFNFSPLEKRALWIQQDEIDSLPQSAAHAISECVKTYPAFALNYVRGVVETYLACTPADCDSMDVSADVDGTEDIKRCLGECTLNSSHPSVIVLRGFENHLFVDMAKDRLERKLHYISNVVSFYKMLVKHGVTSQGYDILAAAALRSSLPSRRFAAALGTADAKAVCLLNVGTLLHKAEDGTSSCSSAPWASRVCMEEAVGCSRCVSN